MVLLLIQMTMAVEMQQQGQLRVTRNHRPTRIRTRTLRVSGLWVKEVPMNQEMVVEAPRKRQNVRILMKTQALTSDRLHAHITNMILEATSTAFARGQAGRQCIESSKLTS